MTKRKLIDLQGVSQQTLDKLSQVNKDQSIFARGIGGDPLLEGVPTYIKTSSEKIIENGNNATIVLGRDRPGSRLSGYGGKGSTHASSIDLVAGRMGFEARTFDPNGKRIWVDPSFEKDASRIYISQKADIDDYFNIKPGKVGNSIARSGIGIKADAVRIIGREGIKLVTRIDRLNSQGGQIDSISGIDLIAGNEDKELQPMTRGKNTIESIRSLAEQLDKLNGIVHSLLQYQMAFNEALTHHWHHSPFFGLPTTPSPTLVPAGITCMINHLSQTAVSLMTQKANISFFKQNFLSPSGGSYILSRWNNNN